MWRVATDTGGTFTDLVAIDGDGNVLVAKVPSTPPNFEQGVVNALIEVGVPLDEARVLYHGTTVTTNALLTRSGAPTAFVTTEGFRDVLEIRHGNRADVFDVMWDPPQPLVRRANRLEVHERVNYRGDVLVDLDEEDVRRVARLLRKRGIGAVGISLMHSYANAGHEERVRDLLTEEMPDLYVTASVDIMAEPPEFERASTVVANAYVGPVLTKYMQRLEDALRAAGHSGEVLVMHSGGGMMTTANAMRIPARTAVSGPAAGAVAAAAIGSIINRSDIVSFDMGGTSADLATIRGGQPRLSMQHDVEWGMPIGFPSVDVVPVGAGGGSIAWIDEGGAPHTGPQSAGSVPGPACYGRGGTEPTNTDANLVLGRITADAFLDGRMALDIDLAKTAIQARIAEPLGLGLEEAAEGILRISNENMVGAVRKLTVERGLDPREFSLMAFGGAGPLHAVDLARGLQMREVIVPPSPGATSALGLLFVDNLHDLMRAYSAPATEVDVTTVTALYDEMESEIAELLSADGFAADQIEFVRYVELRYAGQVRALRVPMPARAITADTMQAAVSTFHSDYESEFKYAMTDAPVETKTLRLVGAGRTTKPALKRETRTGTAEAALRGTRAVYFDGEWFEQTPVYTRTELLPGAVVAGPAIVEQYDTTTVVQPGATVEVDEYLNLLVTPNPAA